MHTKTVRFDYPLTQLDQPIVTMLVKNFDVAPNILSANIDPRRGGWLIVELQGQETAVSDAIAWSAAQGVTVTDVV